MIHSSSRANFFILVVAELKVLVVSEEADFLMLFKLHIPHKLAHIQQIEDEMSTSGHLEVHVLDA